MQGYAGVLCGSCDGGYGRSRSFDCIKCYQNAGTLSLFILSLIVLLFLSGFAIRSNLHTRTMDTSLIIRASKKSIRRRMSAKKLPTEVPVNFQMVEMLHSGHVPPEMVHPDLLTSAVHEDNEPKINPVVAKQSVVEIFKVRSWHKLNGLFIHALQITINFLQVVAAAVYINTSWTDWMRNLLLTAGAFCCL